MRDTRVGQPLANTSRVARATAAGQVGWADDGLSPPQDAQEDP